MRECDRELSDVLNITAAIDACNNDEKCSSLSTNNENCKGAFKLCNGTGLDTSSRHGCTLQKLQKG